MKQTDDKGGILTKLMSSRYFELCGLVCLIVLYSVFVEVKSGGTFLSVANIGNILKEIVVYGILSCALAFPVINGTFDLSIESICALGGNMLCASCHRWPFWNKNESVFGNRDYGAYLRGLWDA